ncbi:acyl-CoA dehydrogenase family protein [Candidatus Poriferisodalis sp.]|uniref:acyl-CoA dehydrogenase family protein n=1 Tax=Candidatus Poriferisodalis sp. TaxID=3101277 RepID=UPI003B023962
MTRIHPRAEPDSATAAAESIAELLRTHAPESERLRHVAPESVRAMANAGLFRLLTPAVHGGAEAGLGAQVASLFIVAAADPSAGWVQMVSNAHAWMVGSFPVQCQAEVFAGGPDIRVPGTLAAQGKATRVEGGWRLDGRWQFASGVDHGDWLLIGAVADVLAESPTRALHVIVPKSEVDVDDTWFTLGLRGTGSKDIVADDVFVPDHRSIATKMLFDGHSPHGEGGATFVNRLPVLVCLSVQLAAAVVGIGRGALDLHIERTAARREVYTKSSKAEDPGAQMRVAESVTELDLARALIEQAADRCDEVARTGERLELNDRAELKWHAAYAVELTRRSVDRVFAAAGAHGIYDDSLLQARYRDINTACHHAIVDFDGNARLYGRTRLGLDPGTPLV